MKTKMAGAALAAVVGACALVGGVERAEAFNVHVFGSGGGTPADGSAGGDFTFFTDVSRLGFGTFSEDYQSFDRLNQYFYTAKSDNVTGTLSVNKASEFITIYTVNAVFNTFTIVNSYTGTDPFFGPPPIFAQLTVSTEPGNAYTLGQINSSQYAFTDLNIVVTTPLPAAAPLFGAALLALGGIGYARRRRSAAA